MLLPCAAIFLTFFGWIIKNVIVVLCKCFLSKFTNSRCSLADAPVDGVLFRAGFFLRSFRWTCWRISSTCWICVRSVRVWDGSFLSFRFSCLIAVRFVWRKDPFKFKLLSRRWTEMPRIRWQSIVVGIGNAKRIDELRCAEWELSAN